MLRTTSLILSLMMVASQAAAQLKSLCTLMTAEDARIFFDKVPDQKVDSPQMCGYGVKAQNVMLTAVNYTSAPNAKRLFDMNRQGMEHAEGGVKDEPGLGATAFSGATKSAVVIFLLKGNVTVQLSVAGDKGKLAPGTLDKLRVVAKKTASRM
jgi:hypothetical protein